MQILLSIVLTSLLLCSFAGYMMLVKRWLGLRNEFIPVVVFSATACAVYFAGLLGVLFPGSIAIMLGGLAAFALLLRRAGSTPIAKLTLFGVGFAIGSILFFTLLLRSHLVHYDNFSHWAIVVKQMLSTGAFPTASSDLIDFTNYPLGTSSFIYYICLFAGRWEPIMIGAQGLLIFAGFYAVFGIISERKRFLLYAFLGLGCASLSYFNLTIRINNLLVDFLLPVLTLAIFAIAYRYRNDATRALVAVAPVAGLLTVTKSTGILFAVIGLSFTIFILAAHREELSRIALTARSAAAVVGSLLPYLAWSLHMRISFQSAENKFDIGQASAPKSNEQIAEITELFLRTATDLGTRPAFGIVVVNLLAVAASILAAVVLHKKWSLWKALLALNIVVILYYAGIWGLYAYSMPWEEASRLAGFERYASSIVILLVGGLALAATIDLENSFHYRIGDVPDDRAFRSITTKTHYQTGVLVCMAASIALLLSEFNGMNHDLMQYPDSMPYRVTQVTGDRWYADGEEDTSRYLLYAQDSEGQVTNFYAQYVGRYYLYAPHVDGIVLFYEDNMDNLLRGYDYFVMVEPDSNARSLLRAHYGIDGDPGVYRIEPVGETGVALHLEDPWQG